MRGDGYGGARGCDAARGGGWGTRTRRSRPATKWPRWALPSRKGIVVCASSDSCVAYLLLPRVANGRREKIRTRSAARACAQSTCVEDEIVPLGVEFDAGLQHDASCRTVISLSVTHGGLRPDCLGKRRA